MSPAGKRRNGPPLVAVVVVVVVALLEGHDARTQTHTHTHTCARVCGDLGKSNTATWAEAPPLQTRYSVAVQVQQSPPSNPLGGLPPDTQNHTAAI